MVDADAHVIEQQTINIHAIDPVPNVLPVLQQQWFLMGIWI